MLAAEEMVEVGRQQHPEWDWPLLATVLQALGFLAATAWPARRRPGQAGGALGIAG